MKNDYLPADGQRAEDMKKLGIEQPYESRAEHERRVERKREI